MLVPPVGENMAPHPNPLPIRWGEGEDRWQQGRARPLTPALSPSDGEREKRYCAVVVGTEKMRPFALTELTELRNQTIRSRLSLWVAGLDGIEHRPEHVAFERQRPHGC